MSRQVYLTSLVALLLGLVAAACATTPPEGVARGKQLFDTCVPCHGHDGGGNEALGAPSIAGLSEWYVKDQLNNFQKGLRGYHPDDMEGHRMRPMARSLYHDGDVASVAAYVASMPKVRHGATLQGGDASAGAAKYAVCSGCHGPDGSGNEGMHAPALNDKPDWYLFRQLQKYHGGLRGAQPQDTFGSTMRAMSTTLATDQDRLDVVAYIRTLSK